MLLEELMARMGRGYEFVAGQGSSQGNLLINGSLDTNSNGGRGGSIHLRSDSEKAFVVNSAKAKKRDYWNTRCFRVKR